MVVRRLEDFTAHADDAHSAPDGRPTVPSRGAAAAAALVPAGLRRRYAEYR